MSAMPARASIERKPWIRRFQCLYVPTDHNLGLWSQFLCCAFKTSIFKLHFTVRRPTIIRWGPW